MFPAFREDTREMDKTWDSEIKKKERRKRGINQLVTSSSWNAGNIALPSTRSIFFLDIHRTISLFNRLLVCPFVILSLAHVLTHPRNDYLEFPPDASRFENYLFPASRAASSPLPSAISSLPPFLFIILLPFLSPPSRRKKCNLLLPFLIPFSLFLRFLFLSPPFFLQRIHRCGYTKLERYHFLFFLFFFVYTWV